MFCGLISRTLFTITNLFTIVFLTAFNITTIVLISVQKIFKKQFATLYIRLFSPWIRIIYLHVARTDPRSLEGTFHIFLQIQVVEDISRNQRGDIHTIPGAHKIHREAMDDIVEVLRFDCHLNYRRPMSL